MRDLENKLGELRWLDEIWQHIKPRRYNSTQQSPTVNRNRLHTQERETQIGTFLKRLR